MSNLEQTLSIIKPDAVERNLENEIKEIFKNKGFSILKNKKIQSLSYLSLESLFASATKLSINVFAIKFNTGDISLSKIKLLNS